MVEDLERHPEHRAFVWFEVAAFQTVEKIVLQNLQTRGESLSHSLPAFERRADDF